LQKGGQGVGQGAGGPRGQALQKGGQGAKPWGLEAKPCKKAVNVNHQPGRWGAKGPGLAKSRGQGRGQGARHCKKGGQEAKSWGGPRGQGAKGGPRGQALQKAGGGQGARPCKKQGPRQGPRGQALQKGGPRGQVLQKGRKRQSPTRAMGLSPGFPCSRPQNRAAGPTQQAAKRGRPV